MPHHIFGMRFGRYYNKYIKRTNLYIKKPLIGFDENVIDYSTSTSC
jgi:hypothetical protein